MSGITMLKVIPIKDVKVGWRVMTSFDGDYPASWVAKKEQAPRKHLLRIYLNYGGYYEDVDPDTLVLVEER